LVSGVTGQILVSNNECSYCNMTVCKHERSTGAAVYYIGFLVSVVAHHISNCAEIQYTGLTNETLDL